MSTDPPVQRFYDLGDLSDAGYEADIEATAPELSRITAWEGIADVERFAGHVILTRRSPTRFIYEASLDADIVQECVVTLQPVRTHISRRFSREMHYSPSRPVERGGAVTLAAAEDEVPEIIESLKFDLTGPLLEEFSLAIDPYPRAPGVAFEPPQDRKGEAETPFAVLKALKQG